MLHLLHQIDELLKGDVGISSSLLIVFLAHELANFVRVSIQALHNGFQVFHVDFALVFAIEKIEDFAQIGNLIFCELLLVAHVGLGHVLLLVGHRRFWNLGPFAGHFVKLLLLSHFKLFSH